MDECIHPSTGPSAACEVGVCGYTCAKHPIQDPALIHEGIIDTLALVQVTLWFTEHLPFLFFLRSLQRHFQAKDVTFFSIPQPSSTSEFLNTCPGKLNF